MGELKDYWIVYLDKDTYKIQFHHDSIRNIVEYHMMLHHEKIYPFTCKSEAINYLQNK